MVIQGVGERKQLAYSISGCDCTFPSCGQAHVVKDYIYLFPLPDVLYRQIGNLTFWTMRYTELPNYNSGRHQGVRTPPREIPSLSICILSTEICELCEGVGC